ncbi:DEKNAAC100191 [Brettanomyces naardenensis]|uniref:DEKNAAC100191 n=1 Tax=Brettanomyces naardenensis TaxID=13370 RepID=A0A448YFJ1_BRENA|nr:DEKNAAC100191 [Brettanomyces naardenensis]
MGKLTTLTHEEMDNVIFDARSGDLETLKAIFTDEVEPSVLPKIQDEFTLATPFHMAAANGHTEVLTYLLSLLSKEAAKEIVNRQNDSGNTALHWAAYNGHTSVIKLLCEAGADPFIQNSFKHDSFYEAQNSKHDNAEKYLLERFGDQLEAANGDEKEDGEEKVDEDNVEYSAGTEIQKISEGGAAAQQEQEDQDQDVEFLKQQTEDLKV